MIVITTNGKIYQQPYDENIINVLNAIGGGCETVKHVHVKLGTSEFDMLVDDDGYNNQRDDMGAPKVNLKATNIQTTGWLVSERDTLDWAAAGQIGPILGNVVCVSRDSNGSIAEIDEAAKHDIFALLNEPDPWNGYD